MKLFYMKQPSIAIERGWAKYDAVASLDKERFVLRDGADVPISRACRKAAQDAFWSRINSWVLER